MKRVIAVLAIALGLCSIALGQTPAPASGAPSSTAQMVRAAGMPLNDGALPPGSLTVRLVHGAFTSDVTGLTVEIELDRRETRRARTGEKGRAEFAHLPIGSRVRAWATVNGEKLESEPFPMPAESGVRLLLVAAPAGSGAGRSDANPHQALPAEAAPPPPTAAPLLPSATKASGVTIVQVVVVSMTILVFVLVGAPQRRRRL